MYNIKRIRSVVEPYARTTNPDVEFFMNPEIIESAREQEREREAKLAEKK